MNNQVPNALKLFLENELKTTYQVIQGNSYSRIICPNLNFDVLYYTEQVPLLDESIKKIIHINAEQFLRDSPKILNRLRVMAGKAIKIYARQTVLTRIDKQLAMEFQIENHL